MSRLLLVDLLDEFVEDGGAFGLAVFLGVVALRQYFPRSTDFRAVAQSDLDAVAAELNDRPRQTLGWKSPCQTLDQALR